MAQLTRNELIIELKKFIPKYLWEYINHPSGFIVNHEEFNEKWNLNVNQGDLNSKTLYQLIQLIIESVVPDLEVLDEIMELIKRIEGLSAIIDMKFYNNGFQIFHKDGTHTDWLFDVDNFGQINALYDETHNKNVTVEWLNTER